MAETRTYPISEVPTCHRPSQDVSVDTEGRPQVLWSLTREQVAERPVACFPCSPVTDSKQRSPKGWARGHLSLLVSKVRSAPPPPASSTPKPGHVESVQYSASSADLTVASG